MVRWLVLSIICIVWGIILIIQARIEMKQSQNPNTNTNVKLKQKVEEGDFSNVPLREKE